MRRSKSAGIKKEARRATGVGIVSQCAAMEDLGYGFYSTPYVFLERKYKKHIYICFRMPYKQVGGEKLAEIVRKRKKSRIL